MLKGTEQMKLQVKQLLYHLLSASIAIIAFGALALQDIDPRTAPVPDFSLPDPDRAIILSVFFQDETTLEVLDVRVANTRARGYLGDPEDLLIELIDRDGNVFTHYNAVHPLWEYDRNEDGDESKQELPSGPGTIFIPLSGSLASVKISDQNLAIDLAEVSTLGVVTDYCNSAPSSPVCDDEDGDGVININDLCQQTNTSAAVDPESGCSVSQLCPCEGPLENTVFWKNHGEYVECISRTARDFRKMSFIGSSDIGEIVSKASKMNCGQK